MKERAILFSGEMVRAILENRKSQTRRIVKPQPVETVVNLLWCPASRKFVDGKRRMEDLRKDLSTCPYGVAGERLWVRETWSAPDGCECKETCHTPSHVYYWSDNSGYEAASYNRKRPSIFMPRWASRITLEITKVRVERLKDISDYDARREGIKPVPEIISALPGYRDLWDSINGKGAWDKNPWVWVVEFRKI